MSNSSADLRSAGVQLPMFIGVDKIMQIQFYAEGIPKGQPRPRAFARKVGNKFMARVYDAGTAEGWKSSIAIAARESIPSSPLEGALHLSLDFIMPRPKCHFRTGKRCNEMRDDAPGHHTSKPDCDNLAKAVMDCLTQVGMWKDDEQVANLEISKRYGPKPGVFVIVRKVSEPRQSELQKGS